MTESQFAGREDLRDMIIFTIDGDDARDFDDAVSLTLKDNGNYYLGVHIADVSEYVKEGTALENEAYKRVFGRQSYSYAADQSFKRHLQS